MINGTIRVEELDGELTVAALRVRLLDTSMADGPSTTVVEQVQSEIVLRPGERVEFTIPIPDGLDPAARHELTAHADVDGSGDVTVGDYLHMVSTPVEVDGTQGAVELVLREVRS